MEIRVLGCYGGADKTYRLTSFLVNSCFAIDAGAIVTALSFEEQKQITDVYISHVHMDHTVGLPFLIDNIFGTRDTPLKIHAIAPVIRDLKEHMFNDVFWPDFTQLPSRDYPTVVFNEVPINKVISINGLSFQAIMVNHLIPTAGLIVSEGTKSWIYPSDTHDTSDLWKVVNDLPDPRLLFLECSFPNRFDGLAEESRHLTPNGVALQLSKLKRQIKTRLYHFKPNVVKDISEEIHAIDHPDLDMLEQDQVYKI